MSPVSNRDTLALSVTRGVVVGKDDAEVHLDHLDLIASDVLPHIT